MTTTACTRIAGLAYGRRATLEVAGDTLTWRAHRGEPRVAENIVTTIHDVRGTPRWIEQYWSMPGGTLAVLGILWWFSEGALAGALVLLVAAVLLAYRRARPRLFLVLDVGDRRLIMKVEPGSAVAARTLVDRIDRALESGELPATPPSLP